MINVKNVSKRFENQSVLKEVHFSIDKGSIYGLLGSNGAGKTTLLKIISGILTQDKGHVFIDDSPVFEQIQIKDKVVFLPDTLYFFPQYTIRQMAEFYRNIYTQWNEERFQRLSDVFEIDIDKKIHKLSKGMQRQVAFWLAMSAMPEILVLDEPLDGLDPVMRKKVKNLLVQDVAEREMTVLISSHNLREVEDICDHIGILHKGSIILEKDLDDLKSDVHKVQVAFKKNVPNKLFDNVDLLFKEERGSVLLCIVRGNQADVMMHFKTFEPDIFDILPLTLEEIFIYEMGGVGYAIKNILV
ncbi:ABC transporter ATP-binding protein [Fictibacillus nanhaiensis]|uniref:ABC transporter ATP-binding protein n=1 Tax=Fictibacillus nanhaiensis TaxID=742169 RepID=UPI001C95191A|nr:ABC transporter ATP-binding protein [Fictibacillus nanhaiensis]MBY6037685.1 ABC transporter ATP-binding protein [Fictibacillus nanhaiensis]